MYSLYRFCSPSNIPSTADICDEETTNFWKVRYEAMEWLVRMSDEELKLLMVFTCRDDTMPTDRDVDAYRRATLYAIQSHGPSDVRSKLIIEWFDSPDAAVAGFPDPYVDTEDFNA